MLYLFNLLPSFTYLKSLLFTFLLLFSSSLNANELFLFYEEVPKKIYQNQIFEIKLKLIVSAKNYDDINTSFEIKNGVKVLNKDERWKWSDENIFYNTYYIKLSNLRAKLPKITVDITRLNPTNDNPSQADAIKKEDTKDNIFLQYFSNISDNNESINENNQSAEEEVEIYTNILEEKEIEIFPIKWDKHYSNFIASEFKISDYNVQFYDENLNILAFEIQSTFGNINDFNINNKNILSQKIQESSTNLPYHKFIYYAVIDNNLKEFRFNFFDTSKSDFRYESIPLKVELQSISTQTDLNPKDNNFELLKIILFASLIALFIALFIIKHKYIYLLFVIILSLLFVNMILPLEKVSIIKDAQIKLLPIEKSTVFKVLDHELEVEVLKYKNNFAKIIYKNKVGWVNEIFIKK